MSDTDYVKGSEFLRKLQDLGRESETPVSFVPQRGKGSHGTVYFGERRTVLRNPKDELKKGTLHGMLRQLGIDPGKFGR